MYKLCLLVYKCLHQMAPVYLSEMCTTVSTVSARQRLRSATHGDLTVPATRTNYGQKSFSAAGHLKAD